MDAGESLLALIAAQLEPLMHTRALAAFASISDPVVDADRRTNEILTHQPGPLVNAKLRAIALLARLLRLAVKEISWPITFSKTQVALACWTFRPRCVVNTLWAISALAFWAIAEIMCNGRFRFPRTFFTMMPSFLQFIKNGLNPVFEKNIFTY